MTPFDPKMTFESWGNFSIGKLQTPFCIARVVDFLKLYLKKMQTNTEPILRIRVHIAHFNRNSPIYMYILGLQSFALSRPQPGRQ